VTRVLIVDDEPQILRALRINLTARRFEVEIAPDGSTALRHAQNTVPDLVILDLGLPDLDGVDVIHGLRGWTRVPIIVLSGRAGSQDKVDALDAGADDYVTKPFSIEELLARIRAVTRRTTTPEPDSQYSIGDHDIDLANKKVTGGQPVHLTPTEWHILELLLRNPGKLITQRELLRQVWGPTAEGQAHYARQYLAHLRRKLEPDPARPRHLLTELGMGYRYQP
jgi:two-component system, OmpR family, KDP operon response regulator KdpE